MQDRAYHVYNTVLFNCCVFSVAYFCYVMHFFGRTINDFGAPEASKPSFGAARAPSGSHFCDMFDNFSSIVFLSFRVIFLFVFASVLVSVLCF